MTPAELLQQILLTTAYHYTPERGVIVLAWVIASLLAIGTSPWWAAEW